MREIRSRDELILTVNRLMICAMEDIDCGRNEASPTTLDLVQRIEDTDAALRLALETATRERDEARICNTIVRERVESILANWMRPPGGQQAGVPDKSISPQTCREILRSLGPEQGSYTYEEWQRLTRERDEARKDISKLKAKEQVLYDIHDALGIKWGEDPYARISALARPAPPADAAMEAVRMLRHLCNVYGCTSYGRKPDHGPEDCSWCEAEALLDALSSPAPAPSAKETK